MIEAKTTDRGKTNGIILGIENNKNFITVRKSKSFPANSAINNQTVWSMNIKNKITNTVANVIMNVFNKYLSNIFTRA
jgi:hypothetical protein